MKHFVLAICCGVAVALVPGCGHSQTSLYGAPNIYGQRPAPPTEPSVPVAEKPAAVNAVKLEPAAPKPAVPKPAVRPKIVHRPGKGPTGPVTTPSPEALVMMVRGALSGVNQANFTENYSVLHGMTTPALQARVTAAQLGKALVSLREQKLNLSPVLVLRPQFTAAPAVAPNGLLRLTGFFPSRPVQINFAIDYLPIDGFWLIDGLSVSAAQAAAPASAPAGTPATSALPTVRRAASAPMPSSIWQASVNTLLFGPSVRLALNPQ